MLHLVQGLGKFSNGIIMPLKACKHQAYLKRRGKTFLSKLLFHIETRKPAQLAGVGNTPTG